MRSLLFTCALSASLAPQAFCQAPIQQGFRVQQPVNRFQQGAVVQQGVAQQVVPAAQPAPEIIPVALRSHDFGTVARSAKTEHKFPITNIYTQPMSINSVRASCGCTTPTIEKQLLQPGETGHIIARFNTGTHTGQKQATVTVSIGAPHARELQLTVRGYIRSDIVFNPGELNFGTVEEGTKKSLDVDLAYAGRNDWKVLNISAKDAFLKPTITEVSRQNGQIKYKISAELTDAAPAGILNTQLLLETNDNRLTRVPLTVMADVQSKLSVNPEVYALGDIKSGEAVEHRIVVRGIKPFKVTEVSAEDMEVQFDPSESAKTAQLILLKLKPDPARAKGVSQLVIKTDLDDLVINSKVTYRVVNQSQTGAVEVAKPLAVVP